MKKRKSILNRPAAGDLEFIEEDGALSTENGDLAILVEFDLDSNFKFIPFRSELNNLIANNFASSSLLFNSVSMSSLHSHFRAQANKSIVSFLSQLNAEQLPELLLQRIAFCNEHSERWRRQIKLAHDIIPKPPPLRAIRQFNQPTGSTAGDRRRVQRTNSLAMPNGHHSNQHSNQHSNHPSNPHHNNNDSKLVCLCERCQFRRHNGLKQDCRMPTMDNILLRTNEFNSLSNAKHSVIGQLFNR